MKTGKITFDIEIKVSRNSTFNGWFDRLPTIKRILLVLLLSILISIPLYCLMSLAK